MINQAKWVLAGQYQPRPTCLTVEKKLPNLILVPANHRISAKRPATSKIKSRVQWTALITMPVLLNTVENIKVGLCNQFYKQKSSRIS